MDNVRHKVHTVDGRKSIKLRLMRQSAHDAAWVHGPL